MFTFITFICGMFVSSVVLADTVNVNIGVSLSDTSYNDNVNKYMAFTPTTSPIVLQVAGKSCKLKTSAAGSVPTGCNYNIWIKTSGAIAGELTSGNNVCTQTSEIASACSQ